MEINIYLLFGLFIIFFIGGYVINEKYKKCNEKITEYRYIPRTFKEDQDQPVKPSEIFNVMFTQASPWLASISELDNVQVEKVNKFFISQY